MIKNYADAIHLLEDTFGEAPTKEKHRWRGAPRRDNDGNLYEADDMSAHPTGPDATNYDRMCAKMDEIAITLDLNELDDAVYRGGSITAGYASYNPALNEEQCRYLFAVAENFEARKNLVCKRAFPADLLAEIVLVELHPDILVAIAHHNNASEETKTLAALKLGGINIA